ncbi:MAG: PAS domain S-box protein [Coleofasciculus sp. S288]|nr:PAS domain S-box protein [Coleofasciculus sp. S288]
MQTELKVNILLVDDQPKSLRAGSALLESLGQNLVRASSGEEALQCLSDRDFVVIILNIRMPGMKGFETAKRIRERPASQHIPIIFITALHPSDRQLLSYYSLGAVDYLFEPIVPELLRSKVELFISVFQKTAERTAALRQANDELVAEIVQHRQAELALRKSEQKYRTLVETIPHGIGEIDTHGIITFCNSALERMLDYKQGELLGKPMWHLSPEPERSNLPGYLVGLVQEQPSPAPYFSQFLTKDGIPVELQMDWNYKRNDKGQVTGVISVVTDITERKRMEEALRISEERFRVALKNSPTVVFTQDTEFRYIWIYNSALGFDAEDVVGKLDAEIFSPEDTQRLVAIKRRVLATGVGTREQTFITFNGEVHYYDLTVEPMFDRAGELVGITCAATDITEVRVQEQQLRAIFEGSLDAIAITDDNGVFVEANPAACQLLGLPLSELLGHRVTDFMQPGFNFHQVWRTFLEQGQLTGEVRFVRSDGTLRDVEYAAKANFLPSRHLGVLRDITERIQAEEMRRALEAEKELRNVQLRFFSMASHEFRTPLSTILLTAQLLKARTQEWSPDKLHRNLQRIETTAKNMTHLLDDILTINRADTGKLECNPHSLNLEEFCRQLVEDLQLNAGSKHPITFVNHGQYLNVWLDEKLLRSILTNLLSNAIKYSPQGGEIHFALTVEPTEVVFQIQDQGIGISPEDQQHLFKTFYRGKNAEHIPGTGLGLTVVKKCLDLQGGNITLTSQVGVGTTVTVTIPLSK